MARRTQKEVYDIYLQYMELKDSHTIASISRELRIAKTTLIRWKNGVIPPSGANPREKGYYYRKSKGLETDDKPDTNVDFELDFDSIAEQLDIPVEEAIEVFAKAMIKIKISCKGTELEQYFDCDGSDIDY
jgi:hypothetical protein